MEVRTATLADISKISGLLRYETGAEMSENTIRGLIESNKNYPAGVAYDGNTLVGFYFCDEFAPDVLDLKDIFVAEAHRSKGIGSRLIKHLERSAAEQWTGVMHAGARFRLPIERLMLKNFLRENGYRLVAETGGTDMYFKSLVTAQSILRLV